MNGKLISFDTTDGLRMKGYLTTSPENHATIIHIHGSSGNFYENDFIQAMSDIYSAYGINFLSVNNRGHDCVAEAYRNGRLEYIGCAHEILEDCIYDIEGAVRFADTLGACVILQGHSIGCLKVLIYLAKTGKYLDSILLSANDPYELVSNYIFPETPQERVERIKTEYTANINALLPPNEFGIKNNNAQYHIPISARSFIEFLSTPLLGLLQFKKSPNFFLNTKTFVYCGGADPYWTETVENIEFFFSAHFKEVYFYYCKDGDHHFHGLESQVIKEIAGWVSQAL